MFKSRDLSRLRLQIMWSNSRNTFCFQLSLLTFAVFVLSNEENVLTAEIAFVSLALFDILKTPLSDIPPLMKFTVQVSGAYKLARYLPR